MIFRWSLSDSKSLHVSRTLLNILFSIMLEFEWSPYVLLPSSPPVLLIFLSWVYQKHQSRFSIIVTFMFNSFFNYLARSWYFSFFSLSFSFIQQLAWTAISTILQVLFFFLLIIMWSGLLAEIIIIIIYSFRVFHISVRWWIFTGVWVTASPFRSSGLVSGFWLFSAMLSFG